jgi:thiol-disulfide isomerase/thioredoxin
MTVLEALIHRAGLCEDTMPNRFARWAAAAAFILVCAAPALAADSAPVVGETLTSAPAAPYDESADAHQALAEALARAARSGKFVMLDFGGNWCPDCRVTAGVLDLGDVRPWIDRNFEVVMIDIGRLNKNLDIGERYDVRVRAVPTIIILDQHGHVVNAGDPAALKDARGMTPQAIVDTIDAWIQKPG